MKKLALVLNLVFFSLCGYVYGVNAQPQGGVDRAAINLAVYKAINY